jgi:hypothetical protein
MTLLNDDETRKKGTVSVIYNGKFGSSPTSYETSCVVFVLCLKFRIVSLLIPPAWPCTVNDDNWKE